ncbi:MAG TPA: DnaJ domain-containing protein [Rhizomicrobium sp.]
MAEVLVGAVALIFIVFMLRAFVGANPSALAKALRYAGAIGLGTLAIGLFYMERPAVGAFVASAAWGLFTGGHAWPGGWPHYKLWGRKSAPAPGQTSSVRTPWLEMELDHESGEMRGTILQGERTGQRLDQLDRDALIAFYTQAARDDVETKRLLEAYLDRTLGAGWNAGPRPEEPRQERAASGMTRAEALKVLGLSDGASEEDIRAAHRRLMLQNHPDRGGTDYLASKINEAKDFLLGD